MGCCGKLTAVFVLTTAIAIGLLFTLQHPQVSEVRFNLLNWCDSKLTRNGISWPWLESLDAKYAEYKFKVAEINSPDAKQLAEEAFNETSTEYTVAKCQKKEFQVSDLERYKHISLLGHVFDVSFNPEMYGVDGGYEEFTGHEGTHHYVFGPNTTTVTETEGLKGLTLSALDELINWYKFYVVKYECIGFISSSYMDKNGEPKKYLHELLRNWAEARKLKKELSIMFPKCVSDFDGKRNVQSCGTIKSEDGQKIQLLPRQLQEPGIFLARCACVRPDLLNHPRIRLFIDCNPDKPSCNYTPRNQGETDWTGVEFNVRVNL